MTPPKVEAKQDAIYVSKPLITPEKGTSFLNSTFGDGYASDSDNIGDYTAFEKSIEAEEKAIEKKRNETKILISYEAAAKKNVDQLRNEKWQLARQIRQSQNQEEKTELLIKYDLIKGDYNSAKSTKTSLGNKIYSNYLGIFMDTMDLGKLKTWFSRWQ